jgi:Na+-driven multidrug efflux pump
MQLWVLTSMVVDSLAVSGQTLVAVALGRGRTAEARAVSERLLQLGLGAGVLLAVAIEAGSPWWPEVFTSDAGVVGQIRAILPLAVLPLPVNAMVYTLDGVLVGASDFRCGVVRVGTELTKLAIVASSMPCLWGLFNQSKCKSSNPRPKTPRSRAQGLLITKPHN